MTKSSTSNVFYLSGHMTETQSFSDNFDTFDDSISEYTQSVVIREQRAAYEKLQVFINQCHSLVGGVYIESHQNHEKDDSITVISTNTYEAAFKFFQNFKLDYPIPDIFPDDDGSFDIGWYAENDVMFNIAIRENIIYYSVIFSDDKQTSGKIPIDDDDCINSISNILDKIYHGR